MNDETKGGNDIMDRLIRVNLRTVEGGYRYVSLWCELSAIAYPLTARVLKLSRPGATDERALGTAKDELREVVREMAALPFTASKQLQTELMQLWKDG